jgi:CubicO group peptidase (beta-lactamase class C family)
MRWIVVLAAALAGCVPSPSAERSPAAAVAPGIDPAAMAELTRDIESGRFGNIHSLIVVRGGRTLYEDYFAGPDERRGQPIGHVAFDAATLHDARSVTKSVVSILFGLAVAEGRIADLDAPVLDYFPEHRDLRTPERMAIRLRHLLTMTSGFEWDESSRPYGDAANSETQMDAAADPYRFVLERPIARTAGEQWAYSGGDTMLLAGIIERATSTSLVDYAERRLFRPLGISRFEWLRYGNGLPIAASGLRLTPRDLARIGTLYLAGGRWNGRQLVPEAWVRDSVSPQARISDRPLGLQRYGYQWYLGTGRLGDQSLSYFAAIGWGGQRILVIPSMELVLVLTAGLYGDRRQSDIAFEILLDRVLPALSDS